MSATIEIYEALGRAIDMLGDPSFAQTQGFTGEGKQLKQIRKAYAQAVSLKRGDVLDLGRLVSDYLSPRSEIASLYSALYSATSRD